MSGTGEVEGGSSREEEVTVAESGKGVKPEAELEVVEERFYTVPFRRVWNAPRRRRASRALRLLKEFVRRHMKTEDVDIAEAVSQQIWSRGIQKPPRRVRIRTVKDKEGRVTVYPAEKQ